jgi:general secretion pathway protein G
MLNRPLWFRMSAKSKARSSVGRGFTLVEMLVVIAIMAILASIGLPLAELSRRRTQEEDLRRSLREIRTAIDDYKRLADAGAIRRAADASSYPPNLAVLYEGIADLRSTQGMKIYLLRRLPRDPFASGDIDSAAETWRTRSYASPPDDPKPGKDVFDVHSQSTGVGMNGVPYRNW